MEKEIIRLQWGVETRDRPYFSEGRIATKHETEDNILKIATLRSQW
jgi:DICT domain-containing protein